MASSSNAYAAAAFQLPAAEPLLSVCATRIVRSLYKTTPTSTANQNQWWERGWGSALLLLLEWPFVALGAGWTGANEVWVRVRAVHDDRTAAALVRGAHFPAHNVLYECIRLLTTLWM